MDKQNIIENENLKIQNGSFIYTKTDKTSILRKAQEVLMTVLGEDPQDQSKGIDLQGVVFNERSNIADIHSEILRNLLTIDEIDEVNEILLEQNKENLDVNITFTYDQEEIEIKLTV